MRSRILMSLVAAVALCAGAAQAAQFERVDLPGAPGGAIKLSGVIMLGDDASFHALAEKMPNAVVITTGPGGSVFAAINIGSEIRNRGWTTLVPPDTYCASACSMIWLAGTRRLLADSGRIGFHAMSIHRDGMVVETHAPDIDLRRWLNALGYTEDTTATIVNTPSSLVRWLDRLELQANGIAVEPYPPTQ
jgi:hypothetical protein